MARFQITEIIQTVNRIEVFSESQYAVEQLYFGGKYNKALDGAEKDISVVDFDVEEIVERPPIDYSQFMIKDS